MTEQISSSNLDTTNDRLNQYIGELSSLDLNNLSDRLEKVCQEILSKQNLQISTISNKDLSACALMSLHVLTERHLTDEARRLYDETVIRALKEEFELLMTKKDELTEQLSDVQKTNQDEFNGLKLKYDEILEVLENEQNQSKDRMIDLEEKYQQIVEENSIKSNEMKKLKQILDDHQQLQIKYEELNEEFQRILKENDLLKEYNAQIVHENNDRQMLQQVSSDEQINNSVERRTTREYGTQTDEQNQDKSSSINAKFKRALQTIKEKVQRLVLERPELFDNIHDDTIDRLDHMIVLIEQQSDRIKHLQNQLDKSISDARLESEKNQVREELESRRFA